MYNTCDIDGDTAHCETYYLFAARNRDDTNWIAGGRYFDRFERRDQVWRIALRTNVIEWSGAVPTMPIPFADVAGYLRERCGRTRPNRPVLPTTSYQPPATPQPAGGIGV